LGESHQKPMSENLERGQKKEALHAFGTLVEKMKRTINRRCRESTAKR